MDGDGHPIWPIWENVRTWWAIRNLPNVLFIHFAEMKRDMPGQMRRIGKFIGATIDESKWDTMVEQCSFEWMKKNATKSTPLGGAFWDGGAETFVHKGENGRWCDVLTAEECAEYEARAIKELGAECAHWLKTGEGA
jgi:aryl sulfotransferase